MDIKKFEEFFESYVNKFIDEAKEANDEEAVLNYTNKKVHTYHVRDNIVKIANGENLKLDMFIIEFIGLFHDIGRFEQFKRYRTFNDALSCNHAKMSIKVLEDEGIISKIDYGIREYIVDPILMHNLQDLPRIEDRKMYRYASLLRDADKLDGFRLSAMYKPEKESIYFKNKSDEPTISQDILDKIFAHKSVYKYDLKTILESQITTFAYITSDIKYDTTLRIMVENDYIPKMFSMMQDTQDSRKVYDFVCEYVKERLGNEEK